MRKNPQTLGVEKHGELSETFTNRPKLLVLREKDNQSRTQNPEKLCFKGKKELEVQFTGGVLGSIHEALF